MGQSGRGTVSETSTLSASVAGRYANALFELAREEAQLDAIDADLLALGAALDPDDGSADLHTLIASPLYSRDDQAKAMAAVTDAMGLSPLSRNVVGLMAEKRRLFALPQVIRVFAALLAAHRGEISAEVTAARPISDAQQAELAATLKASVGQEVKLDVTVDESLIGGLIVKVGSRMIDTSIRSRLAGLQNAMKEVG